MVAWMKTVAILSILICAAASSAIAATVKGTVFEDENKNLIMDNSERGISGVAVSNGVDVVTTAADGSYSLSIDDETVVFITKPRDYKTPVDKNNLPQFFYIHQPNGSPKMEYKGIAATGELPSQLNFPLFKSPEPSTFDVIATTDPQMSNLVEVGYVRDDVAAELVGTKAAFGMTLGDIMYDDLSFYGNYNQVMAQVGIPFYIIPGNHDENYDAIDDHYSLETYKSVYGPPYYSYDYGDVHFVSMDSIGYLGKYQYTGKFGDKQLEWLKNDINLVPKDKLIVFSMHLPLSDITDRKKLFDLVNDREHLLSLAGHTHTIDQSFINSSKGWNGSTFPQCILSTVSGHWWSGPMDERGIPVTDQSDGTPNGYHVFTFSGNQFSQIYKAAGKSFDYQMRISSPDGLVIRGKSLKAIVNVYNGNALTTVEAQLDGQSPIKMKKTTLTDPFIEKLLRTSYKDSPHPSTSQHIWTAVLPNDLAPGIHNVAIRVVDQYGREFKSAKIFEVTEAKK